MGVQVSVDRLVRLANRVREELQAETDTCCEGGAVAALVLITFALDHTDFQVDERVEPYTRGMVQQMLDLLRAGTVQMRRGPVPELVH